MQEDEEDRFLFRLKEADDTNAGLERSIIECADGSSVAEITRRIAAGAPAWATWIQKWMSEALQSLKQRGFIRIETRRGLKLLRLTGALMAMFTRNSVGGEATQQVVYRVKGANEFKDRWKRRIIDLADGKSIEEILDAMFTQEVRAGAWLVDIGIWRNFYDQDVIKTIGELADQGYLRLASNNREECND